jgi:hypothetical protein
MHTQKHESCPMNYQNEYFQHLQKISDLLLSHSQRLLGPQISFIQISEQLIEKKAIKLSSLLSVEIEIAPELEEALKNTVYYKIEPLLHQIIKLIDERIDIFSSFYGTVSVYFL